MLPSLSLCGSLVAGCGSTLEKRDDSWDNHPVGSYSSAAKSKEQRKTDKWKLPGTSHSRLQTPDSVELRVRSACYIRQPKAAVASFKDLAMILTIETIEHNLGRIYMGSGGGNTVTETIKR